MKHLIPGLAVALAIATPASAEVVAVSEAGFVIRLTAEVTTSPQDSWKGLVSPAAWWSSKQTFSGDAANLYIDSQATGCFCEKLPRAADAPEGQRPGSVEHLRIIHADPGNILRLSGGIGPLQPEAVNGTLTITMKPVNGGTRILWEYVVGGFMRYKPEEIAPVIDKMLGEQLASLAAKLGTAAEEAPVAAASVTPEAGESAATPAEPAVEPAEKSAEPEEPVAKEAEPSAESVSPEPAEPTG